MPRHFLSTPSLDRLASNTFVSPGARRPSKATSPSTEIRTKTRSTAKTLTTTFAFTSGFASYFRAWGNQCIFINRHKGYIQRSSRHGACRQAHPQWDERLAAAFCSFCELTTRPTPQIASANRMTIITTPKIRSPAIKPLKNGMEVITSVCIFSRGVSAYFS